MLPKYCSSVSSREICTKETYYTSAYYTYYTSGHLDDFLEVAARFGIRYFMVFSMMDRYRELSGFLCQIKDLVPGMCSAMAPLAIRPPASFFVVGGCPGNCTHTHRET